MVLCIAAGSPSTSLLYCEVLIMAKYKTRSSKTLFKIPVLRLLNCFFWHYKIPGQKPAVLCQGLQTITVAPLKVDCVVRICNESIQNVVIYKMGAFLAA